ncbi:MAG: hypothetical protein ABIO05_01495 [Ferruginibacter sp.]
MNKITNFYQDLIEVVKDEGWKVQHIKNKSITAEFRPDNQTIVIFHKHKNTLFGCAVLGHEIGHLVDFIDGKYKKFFFTDNGQITDKRLIQRVEWSATRFSAKLLKERGFDTSKIHYLSKEYFESMLPDWYDIYSRDSRRFSPKK